MIFRTYLYKIIDVYLIFKKSEKLFSIKVDHPIKKLISYNIFSLFYKKYIKLLKIRGENK